ncbi:hypothetical protein D3H59_30140 [Micromonospora endophytica]|nr:hypothetical protein D3H59_30140 [Micromonospora endophytica]
MLVAASLAALLVGAGLDGADRISSVIAMLMAVVGGAVSLVLWLGRGRQPDADVRWGDADLVARSGPDRPDWPSTWPGYRFDRSGDGIIRVFGGPDSALIDGFPATMNGCAHQRFFIRWRALGGHQVTAMLVSMPDLIPMADPVSGTSGWFASHGCAQPSWSWPDSEILVDVQVSWQVWVPVA